MMNPPRLPPVAALPPNASGYGFYLCLAKDARQGRGGGEYLSLLLQDATGQLAARVFDNVARSTQEFEAGEFVKVHGRTQVHNGRMQLLVERIRRVIDGDAKEGFREEDCTEIAPRPVDEMWAELQALVTGVENTFVRQLLERVVADHEPRLRVWPAAMSVHHAYRSGFLEHVLKVTDVARALARAYGADVDVVTAGALLHDIGKLRELEYDTATTYTREGNLLGHITIGALLVREAAAAIPGFPEALRTHIEHLVLSHHGERELGSPVVPMTAEAFIVAMADDLDAKLNQVRRAIAADAGEGEFTPYHGRLDRKLWKGSRPPATTDE
jgi:3'-5' exoribonuclease